ncbi:Ig-like domain-containing protein [Candidatus Peregrinibacteria bacterium]|nr:Ig-like domain-containing protein [Candidatus Peregrinibacteria bacterium]
MALDHPPKNGDSVELNPLVPAASQQVILEAQANPDVLSLDWFINGVKIATAKAPDFRAAWNPREGNFIVEARNEDLHQKVAIEVVRR